MERFLLAQGGGSTQGYIMWQVYIVECSDKTLYTGIAKDISRRLSEHNNGKGGRYTRIRTPIILAYKESHANRSEALKREAQIKRWPKDKKLSLIKGDLQKLTQISKSRD